MKLTKLASVLDQEPEPLSSAVTYDIQANADNNPAKTTNIPPPTEAVRRHCLRCCNGSALEVRLCPAKSCPRWGYRLGRKPTTEMLARIGDRKMYPTEDELKVADFHKNGGSCLNAIGRRCVDCSGSSKFKTSILPAYGLRPLFISPPQPQPHLKPAQRKIAAARLTANVTRGKLADHRNLSVYVARQGAQATRSNTSRLGRSTPQCSRETAPFHHHRKYCSDMPENGHEQAQ